MKNKLANPLWTHLPAVAALIFAIVYTIIAGPLPSQAAIHFNLHGIPNDYGSPYLAFGITVGIALLFIAISVFFNELWARQEKRKTFNWFSLFDEISIGYLISTYAGYIHYLKSGDSTFGFPWPLIAAGTVGLTLLGVILELVRPYRVYPQKITFGDTSALEKELEQKIRSTASFIYWEAQNPLWVTLLSIVLPLVFIGAAVVAWFDMPWISLLLAILAITMVLPYGGLRTSVTKEAITVSFGLPGFKVLRLKTAEITAVELAEFSPMADFGGYGIRFNKEMWAYYMRGTRGVKFTTTNGKKYLIGSDRPEELYAVAQAVIKS